MVNIKPVASDERLFIWQGDITTQKTQCYQGFVRFNQEKPHQFYTKVISSKKIRREWDSNAGKMEKC